MTEAVGSRVELYHRSTVVRVFSGTVSECGGRDVIDRAYPAVLRTRLAECLAPRFPKLRGAVSDGQHRCTHSGALAVAQSARRRLLDSSLFMFGFTGYSPREIALAPGIVRGVGHISNPPGAHPGRRRVLERRTPRSADPIAVTTSLGAMLDEDAPEVSRQEAQTLAAEHFGIEASAVPLGGERDRNFRIRQDNGQEWVLKVVHPAENASFTEFQSRALVYIAARDPSLPVPRVHLPLHGSRPDILWRRGREHGLPDCRVRMYSFVAGTPMHLSPPSSLLRRNLGVALARTDLALRGLRDPRPSRSLAWDAQHVERVVDLLDSSEDVARRAVSHFAAHAAPRVASLRRQVIHNDFNPHNVLTSAVDQPDIAGIIDFGDMVAGPVVQDLATAAAYQVGDGRDHPLTGPADVAIGYHLTSTLSEAEVEVLFDLIVARLVLIVAITDWRARRHPGNRDYILRNSKGARIALRQLAAQDCRDASTFFRESLGRAAGF